ncbi:sulfotransferase domain-containing protein [Kiritimatiella glycovorans]|uniref:Sulfotransferase domain protein n=1 Tax=Kiritimatiella glycovorans TaxID=1307763 RepID=A0A0G3EDP3_9BACT|nr:sulfotransferase domain-containing protein [Kiritimatiella glycovorans]AKJ64453.1 Sulfotransferase domain protein [Kiritimatiella glycovorans]
MNDVLSSGIKRAFRMRCLNHRWFNTTMVRRRKFDGHILSMQQSGTHWLRYMLSLCMAEVYEKPAPETIQDMDFIGRPKQPPKYSGLPRIVSSHSLPHGLMFMRPVRDRLEFPRYLILVRDPQHALVSHYEKWKARYGVDFSSFLRGDVRDKLYFNDIWRQLEFLNGWGRVVCDPFFTTMTLKYENMKRDPEAALKAACEYFGIPAGEEVVSAAVHRSTKSEMAERSRPRNREQVIRNDRRDPMEWFTEQDRKWWNAVCRELLDWDAGYGLHMEVPG